MCIDLSIWIPFWELHHHARCGFDDPPSQKDVFQVEGLDLLTVFCCSYPVKLVQQEPVKRQHHQLEDDFISHERFEQRVPNCLLYLASMM